MNRYSDYITTDHRIMLGKPTLKGTRITVELILRKLSQGATVSDLLQMYPHLNHAQVNAVFEYAADILANEDLLEAVA
jgi:uncharacterized protein (DUF433 family)